VGFAKQVYLASQESLMELTADKPPLKAKNSVTAR